MSFAKSFPEESNVKLSNQKSSWVVLKQFSTDYNLLNDLSVFNSETIASIFTFVVEQFQFTLSDQLKNNKKKNIY